MTSDKLVHDLRAFGLSGWEAKAYLALVIKGTVTAPLLSNASRIPLSKIYDVLRGLRGKGLVETWATRPYRWRATEPVSALKKIIEQREETIKDLVKLRKNMLPQLNQPQGDGWQVWIANGKRAFLGRAVEMIDRAENIGSAMSSRFSRRPALDDALVAALRRGVAIRMLGTLSPDNTSAPRAAWYAGAGAEVRILPMAVHAILGLSDRKEAAIRIDNGGESDFIWANHPALVNIMNGYFDNLWERAAPLQNLYSK